jgi:hypothetical protein
MVPTMAQPVLFKCPSTGMKVQHLLADDVPEDAKGRRRSERLCPPISEDLSNLDATRAKQRPPSVSHRVKDSPLVRHSQLTFL